MRPNDRRLGWLVAMALLIGLDGDATAQAPAPALPAEQLRALDRISADSLRGHLSFLASDLLEGRGTPSRGLDLAAEYIAAQFRRAGLEAAGDDGYYQTANWDYLEPDAAGLELAFSGGAGQEPTRVDPSRFALVSNRAIDLKAAGIYKLDLATYEKVKPEEIAGKAVLCEMPDLANVPLAERRGRASAALAFGRRMVEAKVALRIDLSRGDGPFGGGLSLDPRSIGRLVDPEAAEPARDANSLPSLLVGDPKLKASLAALPNGPTPATISLHLGEPVKRPVKLRNVVGLLRGSDPTLNQTYVMVTAHYDHLGTRGTGPGDQIYNGANDDGSGTVSVVELATTLATLNPRPKRSLVFVTFFGEEKGLLGSRYYGKHPIFPIEKTVADVNLEQVGRTDSNEGPQLANASLTGFGFSDVSTIFAAAGEAEGVRVYRHPQNSDAYFSQSDNQSLADLGVPAHTLCVAYAYPDYHGAADHWDKVDYANMAKVDRMLGRALLTIADNPDEPKWDPNNPKAARYLKAWGERHPR